MDADDLLQELQDLHGNENDFFSSFYQGQSPLLQREMTMKWNLCEYNADCDLPQICCPGLFINYCCDIGGHMRRRRRRMTDLPNITFPIPLLKPVPAPLPVPVPIPVPRVLWAVPL